MCCPKRIPRNVTRTQGNYCQQITVEKNNFNSCYYGVLI